MRNPWTKKNPFLSMWLSGANSVLGSARGQAAAHTRRQTNAMMTQGMQTMTRFWTDILTPPSSTRGKRRP